MACQASAACRVVPRLQQTSPAARSVTSKASFDSHPSETFVCKKRRTCFCYEQSTLSCSPFAGWMFSLLHSKLDIDMCLTQKSRGSLQVNARDLNAVERGIRGYQANAEKNVKNGQPCTFRRKPQEHHLRQRLLRTCKFAA